MPKYTALAPIHHDGKAYAEGDQIVLEPEAAHALLRIGAVQDARDSAAQRKASDKPSDPSGPGGQQPA